MEKPIARIGNTYRALIMKKYEFDYDHDLIMPDYVEISDFNIDGMISTNFQIGDNRVLIEFGMVSARITTIINGKVRTNKVSTLKNFALLADTTQFAINDCCKHYTPPEPNQNNSNIRLSASISNAFLATLRRFV